MRTLYTLRKSLVRKAVAAERVVDFMQATPPDTHALRVELQDAKAELARARAEVDAAMRAVLERSRTGFRVSSVFSSLR
jgi:hypothetical protein